MQIDSSRVESANELQSFLAGLCTVRILLETYHDHQFLIRNDTMRALYGSASLPEMTPVN